MKKYVCPMHPEVISDKLKTCPKCGMDLVPLINSKNYDHKNHKDHTDMEQDFKRRFLLALPFTLIILILSPKIQQWFHFSIVFLQINLLLFILTSVVVLYMGLPFYQMAKGELKKRNPGMMALVSLAVLSGYVFSVAATFLFKGDSLYWEVSTLVLVFLFGHWMEMRAVRGASGALTELAKLIPPTAHKIKSKIGAGVIDIKTEELVKGDLVLIKPGEKVPIDGIVIDGESSINESMVTGESRPVFKKKGSEIIGGTINNDGSLTIKVTKTGEKTAVSQIMELISSAQESKPPVQKLADRAASWLTIIALTVGIGTFTFWFFINPQGAVFAATLAITVIVITCPHALGLAIPTVTTITTALAAKNGILIRDMKAAEIARKLNYVVFDKTGTLTEEKFGVSEIVAPPDVTKKEVLSLAASLEYHSQHPIAQAIIEKAKSERLPIRPAQNFLSIPGKGAKGKVGNDNILVGNKILMDEKKIAITIKHVNRTIVFVAKNRKMVGAIVLEDIVRSESKDAVRYLKDLGIKTAMLTGDNKSIALSVAKRLGIDTYFAQVLPEEKVNKIKELQKEGNIVAMVGDGVNDAASLAQSHVGIAIGAGTDIAVQSAEIVLVKNDPRDVVKAIKLSQKTNTKMKQNLAWATGYNIIAIPLAAGVLFKFGILLRPEWAALLMSASSIIVVFNALLLRRTELT